MNKTEFERILNKGETTTVEFKSWVKTSGMKERIKLAVDELIAFANAKGGTVYFGVEDDGTVTGCTGYDIQNLIEAIYDKTRPPLFVDVEEIEYDARIDMKQPIVTVLDRLTEKIQNYNKILNVQVGLFRLEIEDFPEKVFQEALLNALSHRDYQKMGAIYVKHYPDKIVIENPGAFLEGITDKNIITHPSLPRNKLIAETLQRLRYVQRTGQGVDIIFREMISMGKPYPEYYEFADAVSLTLRSTTEDTDFVKFIVQEQEKQQKLFSLSELMILRHFTDNKRLKLSEAQELTQVPLDAVKKSINNLVKMGLIETVGRAYMLTAKVYSFIKSDLEYTQDKVVRYIKAKEMILEYLHTNENITNEKVQQLCGYSRQQARTILERMKKDELIYLLGRGRGAKYMLTNGK